MLYHHCPHTHRDFNNRYHNHDSHGPSCTLSRDYALRPDHAARLERHERVYLEYARRAKRSQLDDRREGLAGEGRKSLDIEEEFSRDESARGHRDRRARDTKKTRPGREDRSRHEKHADDGHRPGERERLGCGMYMLLRLSLFLDER
jgi:hypothetical protein